MAGKTFPTFPAHVQPVILRIRKRSLYAVKVTVYFLLSILIIKAYTTGAWFNIKMTSYQYRKSHCGDKTILRPFYLHSGISYIGKMTSLYWIRAQDATGHSCAHLVAVGRRYTNYAVKSTGLRQLDWPFIQFVEAKSKKTTPQRSVLLALCEGNPPLTDAFPSRRTSNVCFHVMAWSSSITQTLVLMGIQLCAYHGFAMREVSVNSTSLYQTN